MQLLGQALGPIALLLVGVTLAFTKVGHQFGAALRIALVKCVVHPLVLAALGWSLGLSGMPLAVMIVAAALPVGANVFCLPSATRWRKKKSPPALRFPRR